MDETLVSDLVAIIRRFPAGSDGLLAARLEGQAGAPPAAELDELARRAHVYAATDEEIALSLVALLVASSAERP